MRRRKRYLDNTAPADNTANVVRPVNRMIRVKQQDTPARRDKETREYQARVERGQRIMGTFARTPSGRRAANRAYAVESQKAKQEAVKEEAAAVVGSLFKPLMPSTYVDMTAAIKNGQVNSLTDVLAAPYLTGSWSERNPGKALGIDMLPLLIGGGVNLVKNAIKGYRLSRAMDSTLAKLSSPYEYPGGNDRLKQYFLQKAYDDILHGRKSIRNLLGANNFDMTKGLEEDVITFLDNNTIGRRLIAANNEPYINRISGLPDESKSKLAEYSQLGLRAKESLRHMPVTYVEPSILKGAGYDSEVLGVHFSGDNKAIAINRNNPDIFKTARHEGEHEIDDVIPLTKNQHIALNQAYDQDFLNLPNLPNAGSLAGYNNMHLEKSTTNGDARYILLGDNGNKQPIVLQNKIIDKVSDDRIFNAVEKANGYGERYIKYLRETNKLTPEKANQFRQAMKIAGVIPFGFGWSLYNK